MCQSLIKNQRSNQVVNKQKKVSDRDEMIRPKVKKTLKVNDTPKKVKEIKATILNQE